METQTKREVTITKIFNAPRELVFKVWTEPEHMKQWWMPKGFTIPVCELDVKPGGKIRILAKSPDFPDHWMGGEFREVIEPEKLVFATHAFENNNGSWGLEGINTILFEDIGGKTKITVHAALTKLDPQYSFAGDGMNEGWKQTLDKLDDYINSLKN